MAKLDIRDDDLDAVRCEVQWRPLSETSDRQPMVCIDGRYNSARVGAPGGDMGEFLLLVAAYERLHGQPASPAWIDEALGALIDEVGPLHMHTDEAALDLLAEALAAGEDDSRPSLEQVEQLVRHPDADRQEALADLLVLPKMQGCGHINQMMQAPEAYGIALESIQAALRAFYRRLWAGSSDVELEVLLGTHCEEAIVVVEHSEDPDTAHSPALAVDNEGASVFIEHPQARLKYRRRFLDALVAQDLVDAPDKLWELADELESVHRDQTIQGLCPDLPIYRLEVGSDATAAVRK